MTLTHKDVVEISFRFKRYGVRENESMLSALLRQGSDISFSCGKGSCMTCLQRCTTGVIPVAAQQGVKPELARKGYFLPCLCFPTENMTVELPRTEDCSFRAVVVRKQDLSRDVCRILLEAEIDVQYRAGQCINVLHPGGEVRSYSLASVPAEEPYLEVHVQRVQNGLVSSWLHDEVAESTWLTISEPFGDNFFRDADTRQPLVLTASGTGLAPVYGILKSARLAAHDGRVHLYWSATDVDGLYLHSELLRFQRADSRFHYHPYVTCETEGLGVLREKWAIAERPFLELGDDVLATAQFHVAGQPATVQRFYQLAEGAGIARARIHADSFETRHRPEQKMQRGVVHKEHGPRHFAPDPEMWSALRQGKLLREILEDFYTRVFTDTRLSPYFSGVTKERVVEKVYSYLNRVFSGDRGYFGEHPRNAHHWMVIDNDLFDYRESLLAECMTRAGLPEHLIGRWRAMEDLFRRDIVKGDPWGRIVDGVELPVGGFAEERLDMATLCDGCAAEIPAGNKVLVHTRLGTVYGACCHTSVQGREAPGLSL